MTIFSKNHIFFIAGCVVGSIFLQLSVNYFRIKNQRSSLTEQLSLITVSRSQSLNEIRKMQISNFHYLNKVLDCSGGSGRRARISTLGLGLNLR